MAKQKTKAEMTEQLRGWLESEPTYGILRTIYDIIFPCLHPKTEQSGDSRVCSECGIHFGWWCPKSLDHACHYFSDEKRDRRVIHLSSGEEFILPKDHNPENETDDECLFCGAPDERK